MIKKFELTICIEDGDNIHRLDIEEELSNLLKRHSLRSDITDFSILDATVKAID